MGTIVINGPLSPLSLSLSLAFWLFICHMCVDELDDNTHTVLANYRYDNGQYKKENSSESEIEKEA